MTTLHLIRHGRASALEADYDQLQPLGELQSRLLGAHFGAAEQRFDAVYVGPHRRQLATWALIREGAGRPTSERWPEANLLEGLAEGPFELLMKHHIRPRLPHDSELREIAQAVRGAQNAAVRDVALSQLFDYMVLAWRRGEIEAPGLESAREFSARVRAVVALIVEREGRVEGRHVAVVTSNGVIGQCLDDAGLPPSAGRSRHSVHNASVSRIELRPEGLQVHACDSTEHLPDPSHLTVL